MGRQASDEGETGGAYKAEHRGTGEIHTRVAGCLQTFIPRGTRGDRRNGRALRGERGTFYVLERRLERDAE